MSPRFRVLLLPEDARGGALLALVRKLFREKEDDWTTTRVAFEDLPEAEALVLRAKAHLAAEQAQPRRGQPDRRAVITFYRYLSRKLAERTLVVHHTDGDCAWSSRPNPEAQAKRDHFRRELERVIATPEPVDRSPARGAPTRPTERVVPDRAEVDRRLKWFVDCVPYYSIEAWTYRATDHAIALCRKHHGGKDVHRFEAWSKEPTLLDEHVKPKHSTCLGGDSNADLAAAVRHVDLIAIGKSFHAFAESLRAIPELNDALATW